MPERLVRNVFDWDHFLIYLAGPMDQAHDGGRGWRADWTERLMGLGLNRNQILNPAKKPLSGTLFELDNEAEITKQLRDAREWAELEDKISQIAHIDLRLVDKSDLIIAHFPRMHRSAWEDIQRRHNDLLRKLLHLNDQWDNLSEDSSVVSKVRQVFSEMVDQLASKQVPTYGTMHEIVEARRQRKPVLVVWEGGKENCSGWLMWLVGHEHVFSNFDSMYVYMQQISQGERPFDIRDWLLLDLDKHK